MGENARKCSRYRIAKGTISSAPAVTNAGCRIMCTGENSDYYREFAQLVVFSSNQQRKMYNGLGKSFFKIESHVFEVTGNVKYSKYHALNSERQYIIDFTFMPTNIDKLQSKTHE